MTVENPVLRPLVCIFLMQTVITMAIYSIPVIIPLAAADLGLAPESVGYLVTAIYGVSTITGLLSQAMIARFGPTGLFSLLMLGTALAIAVLLTSTMLSAIASALLLGLASGPMNPTGSHILARVVPAARRSLIFSIKQCATPAGGMLAGVLLPGLMLAWGWKHAMFVIPVLALLLLPLAWFGQLGKRQINRTSVAFSFKTTARSLSIVVKPGPVRDLTVTAMCLAAAQMALATYLVVYLWKEIGLSEAQAGLVFAVLHFAGIIARVILGFIADRFKSAKWILVGICMLLAMALILMGLFDQNWSLFLIYSVVVVAGATGNGWVGLYYAELARLSIDDEFLHDRIAEVTGASQFFTYIGLMSGPMLFGGLLAILSDYQSVLMIFALILVMATYFLVRSDMVKTHT